MTRNHPDIDTIARDCIAVRLRLVNRVITNLYDDALRPLGLKVSQMNILVAAAKLGTTRPADVGQRLQIDPSTLTRNLRLMRQNGWIEDLPGDDARARPFRLTPAGHRLLARAAPAWQQAQDQAARLLGEDGATLLDRLARQLGLDTGPP